MKHILTSLPILLFAGLLPVQAQIALAGDEDI